MIALRATLVLMLSVGLPNACAAAQNGDRLDGAQFGVYLGPGCDGAAKLPDFEHWLGRPVARVVDFLDQRGWKEMRDSIGWIVDCWKAAPVGLTISVPMIPADHSGNFQAGAAGAYDGLFRDLGRKLVSSGRADAIVRIGWEFNGDWFPWSAAKDPAGFVAFWRRIVVVMRSVQGQRFRFEWCFDVNGRPGDLKASYPGDDVVDIISADIYNQFWDASLSDPEKRWAHFRDKDFGLRWHVSFARAHGKEIAYPEWGTGFRPDGHGAGDDPVFIDRMAQWIDTSGARYQAYWNSPSPEFDAYLQDDRLPKAAVVFKARFGR